MNGGIILPQFDPFLINFGGFGIRWYALAYIAGLLGGYWILRREAGRHPRATMPVEGVDSLLNHVLLGVILGGRLGYVIFYNPEFFLANPLDIIKVWQGGMSFHGGLLGVTVSMWLFARRWRIPVLAVSDRVAMVLPIGLLLGRLSNFINAELYGRVTDLPWGMVFPGSDGLPRHPSQLYEAGLEGLALGMVMFVGWRRGWLRRTGTMTAVLLVGYGSARFLVEYVREPDAHLGLMLGVATMGQILCLPMLAAGGWILWRRRGA
jgi:phosphatidylglycerol:prolipoprotein diacylglycerol transferase